MLTGVEPVPQTGYNSIINKGDDLMTKQEYRAAIWGNTVKAVEEYPEQFTRSEHSYVQRKFEDNLHAIMHRAGEVNTDGEY